MFIYVDRMVEPLHVARSKKSRLHVVNIVLGSLL